MKTVLYARRGFSSADEKYFAASEAAFMKHDIRFKHNEKNPEVIVNKTSKKKMSMIYPQVARAGLSVTDRGVYPMQIHLLKENWDEIPLHLGSDFRNLDDYRVALISHEFAHVLGHDHVSCACVGCDADIRQQPSRSLEGCRPTTKVIFNSKSPHTDRNL